MSSTTKLKMNYRKFNTIWTTVVAVLAVVAIAATVVMNFFSLSMEIFLGRGARVVEPDPEMSNVDTAYYESNAGSTDELNERTNQTAQAIAEQGIVLMKNNNDALPIAKQSKVTPFGYRYGNPIYGGTGSGSVNTASSRIYTAKRALSEFFTVNSDVEKAMDEATARGLDSDGYQKPDEKTGFKGSTDTIIEFDPSIYDGLEDSANGTTGIVFIGCSGGEGGDVTADMPGSAIEGKGYADGTPHQLAISQDERNTIKYAKENCDKVVVIIDSSNVMEIGDLMNDDSDVSADAILWIGGPGGQGFKAMSEILCGDVNPSGKTVDTWMTDIMEDPSMSNFGNAEYENLYLLQGGYPNSVGDPTEMNFIEYEENIYVGYRYYETVDDTGGTFTVNGKDNQTYADAVQMPFGYGLSYGTDFSQEIVSTEQNEDSVTLKVHVTNNGTKAGKDVVQVYYNPPYTDFDAKNSIEKSTVNLIAFEKTDDIQPGAAQDITVTVTKEDMASYSYAHENSDTTLGNTAGSKVYTTEKPTTNANNGLTLSDLRGVDFNDAKWDQLLDQLDLSESDLYVALAASYDQTAQISSISKPATVDFDGPQGIVGAITDATEYIAYPTEPIIAATFNKDLSRQMGCMNYLGTTWGGADYALNTDLLRNEWGFNGFLISDMVMNAGSNSVDQALRSGTDSWMAWGTAFTSLIHDTGSATGVATLRRAVKDMSYAIVNSRAMDGIAPGTKISYRISPWKIWLYSADAAVAILAIGMTVVMIRRTKHAKANPDLYKPRKLRSKKKEDEQPEEA